MAATSATKVSLKLLVDKTNNVVLFAEAGKDFVDFLFHLLAMPVGTVIRLLTKKGMVGSLGDLYDSVETLSDDYMQSPNKDSLLKPGAPSYGESLETPLLLPKEYTTISTANSNKTIYKCYSSTRYGGCSSYVSFSSSAACPGCRNTMNQLATFVEGPKEASGEASSQVPSIGGYVKGVVTYMVMDNLVVKPMSTISSITLLNNFNVKDLSTLEEKIVDFGFDEAVKLLGASMQSKAVLTDVFLGAEKKKATRMSG